MGVLLPFPLFSILLFKEDQYFNLNYMVWSPTTFIPNSAVLPPWTFDFFIFFFQTLYCFFSFLLSSVATRFLGAVSPNISLNSDPGNEHPDKVFSEVRTGRLCDSNDKLWGFGVVICVSSELSAWDLEQKERSSSPIPAPVLQSLSPTLLSVKYVRGCLF